MLPILLPLKHTAKLAARYTAVYSGYENRTMSSTNTPVEDSIRTKLQNELEPSYIDVINESHMHNVPKGAETHFKVVVVSDEFTDLTLVQRHRAINHILKEEIDNGVHALSIIAKTPDQWSKSDKNIESSPNCRGGFGK